MTKRLISVAGAAVSVCAGAPAQGQKMPRLLGEAIQVTPISVARALDTEHGVQRVGDWIAYSEGVLGGVRVFDCFGDADSDGFMDDAGGCGLGISRWYFGTGYCNGLATNDMTLPRNGDCAFHRVDLAWYWTCAGFGTEQCVIGVWTQESEPCDLDTFDYSGWLLNYGTLSCNPGGYYYSNVDLRDIGSWPAPSTGTGSYIIAFLTSSGAALATCAQPMLWGASNSTGGDPHGPGTQQPQQLDDDNPVDGSHTTNECYGYSCGVCPDPLGAMAQFWTYVGCHGPCAYADCNDDGIVDTRDFTCFLNLWAPKSQGADCDGTGTVDSRDFTCFLNQWVACR